MSGSQDVPDTVDFVMYWWHKSAELVRLGKTKRFGLITTNSISQIRQRKVIEYHQNKLRAIRLVYVIPDHPWSEEGAAVRTSMTVAELNNTEKFKHISARIGTVVNEINENTPEETANKITIQIKNVEQIFGDLKAGVDIGSSKKLLANAQLSCRGMEMRGSGFLLTKEQALNLGYSELDRTPEVIKKYRNGKDITDQSRNLYTIDLFDLPIEEIQSKYSKIYQWIYENVKPERDVNRRKASREKWWIYGEARATFRPALKNLKRYIVTVETSKHCIFIFLNYDVLPDNRLIAIALDDAYCLGVLSSNIHVMWALASGGTLEDRPVYTKTKCFDPFPFPDPTPTQKQKIRELGERLDRHRKQVQAQHPEITITGMYNLLEKLRKGEEFSDKDREYNNKALVSTLKQIHDDLDRAVLEAYGWEDLIDPPKSPLKRGTLNTSPSPQETSTSSSLASLLSQGETEEGYLSEIILDRLVTLNAQRAEEEKNGHIRWLRPEYQAPGETITQTVMEGMDTPETTIITPATQKTFPKEPKAQLAAIRDLLRSSNTPWSIDQIAAQFKNGGRYKNAIAENCDRLEWFSILISQEENHIKYWQYIENL